MAVAVDAVEAATVAMGSLFWSIVVFVGRVLFGRVLFGRVLFGRVASVVVVAFAAAAMAMGIFLVQNGQGGVHQFLPLLFLPFRFQIFQVNLGGVKWGIFFGNNI